MAFLLLIFFLVAASNGVDNGRPMDLPSTVRASANQSPQQNLEIGLKQDALTLAGEVIADESTLGDLLREKLANRVEPAQRVVLITSDKSTTYQRWSDVLSIVEEAGGIPAPQIEEDDGPAKPQSGEGGAQ